MIYLDRIYMKIGFDDLKRFFSNRSFVWFDTKEIRDREKLTQEELKYINGLTLSPFGYGYIFYIGFRKLHEMFFVYVVVYLFGEVYEQFVSPIVMSETTTPVVSLSLSLLSLGIYLVGLFAFIFTFVHGRRLSWNRGHYDTSKISLEPKTIKWESVDELKESEKKWFRYGTIPSLAVLIILGALFFL